MRKTKIICTMGPACDDEKLLKEMIKNYNNNFSVVLFGSFYQNISTIFSDIDVTIVEVFFVDVVVNSFVKSSSSRDRGCLL